MLNIGDMMAYPRGAGGIVLCNLLFKDNETVPVNANKKRTILATILRNLKAPLGGNGVHGGLADKVTGIPVNQKAGALFFLQAARVDKWRNGDDLKKGARFELARYVVHYADGKSENVPVYSEINVDNYKQKTPAAPLPGAQLAWTKPYDKPDQSAAYSMQWNNPHPEIGITMVDLVTASKRWAYPLCSP